MIRVVLLDVDGTLVDSNDAHARAWVQAFEDEGIAVEYEAVRRCIGMGGDKLMPAVSSIEESTPTGQRIAARRREIFKGFLPTLKPFPEAGALVAALVEAGYRCVAASSAKRDELSALLHLAGADSLLHAATSSDDADESTPDPDIVHAAMARAGVTPAEAVMIGDTPYDVEAAGRARVPAIAFRCGGWRDTDLRGAIAIYNGPWDLLRQFDASPLGVRRKTG
ncbi:MAG: HAD family hydrolase [Vicinamibacterales bacterium]